jgi:hypothetical protein
VSGPLSPQVLLQTAVGLVWGQLEAGHVEDAAVLVKASRHLWPRHPDLEMLGAVCAELLRQETGSDPELAPQAKLRWQALLETLLNRKALRKATAQRLQPVSPWQRP